METSCVPHRISKRLDTWCDAPMLKVLHVDAILNPSLLEKYKMELTHHRHKDLARLTTQPELDACRVPAGLFPGNLDEHHLLHEAPQTVLSSIADEGLMPSMGGSHIGTRYGDGTYLAVHASKADSYTDVVFPGRAYNVCEESAMEPRYIVVVRTFLGYCNRVVKYDPAWNHAKHAGKDSDGRFYDSVFAPGGQPGLDYPEIVKYNATQMLPVAFVRYEHLDSCTCANCKSMI